MFGFGKKTAEQSKMDVRFAYGDQLFNGCGLGELIHPSNTAEGTLYNLLIQGEVNRLDTKELLLAILQTQQQILVELKKQNGEDTSLRPAA